MAKRNFNVDIDLQGNQLINAVLDQTVANANAAGKVAYDTASNRPVVHDGTSAKELAFKDDLIPLGAFVGDHDASAGALPTVGSGASGAIDKGDHWRVSVAGTITGLGNVEVGDVIFAKISGASVAADFFVAQTNVDFSSHYENGIELVGGKAGLGNTLVRNTTINTNAHNFEVSSEPDNQILLTDENLYLKALADVQVIASGGSVNVEAAALVILKSLTGMLVNIPSATTVGAPLVLHNATTKEVRFGTGVYLKGDSATNNVAANTPQAFTMSGLTTVRGFQVFDSTGADITSNVVASKATNVVTVSSNVALTGVVVEATGV